MPAFVTNVRRLLFVQAALTAVFVLVRSESSEWLFVTVAMAFAAVGVGASLQATTKMKAAVLAFEGIAVAFGVVGLLAGEYVPGSAIAILVFLQVATAPASAFVEGQVPAEAPTLFPYDEPTPLVPAQAAVVPSQPVVSAPLPVAPPVPPKPVAPLTAEACLTILPQ